MQFGAIVLAHGGCESAPGHGGCAAGGAALGHLNDGNAGVGAFESGHGAGRATADNEHVGAIANDGNLGLICGHRVGVGTLAILAISTNAFTQASANLGSLMCSGKYFEWDFRLEARPEGVRERLVLLRAPPRAAVVAGEIPGAELGVFAEAFVRNQHPDRPFRGVEALRDEDAKLLELLGVGAHQEILRVVTEELAVAITLGQHLAGPEVHVVDRSGNDHLGQAGRARGREPVLSRGIDAVSHQIGQFVGGDVDDPGQIARGRQSLERPAADARSVKLNDLVVQSLEALAHVVHAGRRASERRDRDQRRIARLRFPESGPVSGFHGDSPGGVFHHHPGDPIERDVPNRGIHTDVALGNAPLHRRGAGDCADHDLRHQIRQGAENRAHQIRAVGAAQADGPRDLAARHLREQNPRSTFNHHGGRFLPGPPVEVRPGGAGRLGDLRAGEIGARHVMRLHGKVHDPRNGPRAGEHAGPQTGPPCSWCSWSRAQRRSDWMRSTNLPGHLLRRTIQLQLFSQARIHNTVLYTRQTSEYNSEPWVTSDAIGRPVHSEDTRWRARVRTWRYAEGEHAWHGPKEEEPISVTGARKRRACAR